MMMLMGTVYSWSVFRSEVELLYPVSTLQSGLPYMTALFFYAFFMMLSGKIINEFNTRKLAFLGIIFIVLGWYISSIFDNFYVLILSYGALIGSGVGIVYGIPIFIINKSYQKSGLYTGIILSGFGASPLITAPLVHRFIQTFSLQHTFLIMALISGGVMIPLSFILKSETSLDQTKTSETINYDPKVFYLLYIIFLIGTTIGLMVIGLSHQIGVSYYGFLSDHVALMIAIFALLNGVSRPIFGFIVDKFGLMLALKSSVILIVLATFIGFLNQGQSRILFGVSLGLYWFNLGAFLAMMPASIKSYFGTISYARLYGKMFTSYGLGAILGTLVSGSLLDLLHHTNVLYGFILLLVGILMVLIYRLNKATDVLQNK